ncbi:MAG TPA: AAA family ATPase [Opitutaceae bacterium]
MAVTQFPSRAEIDEAARAYRKVREDYERGQRVERMLAPTKAPDFDKDPDENLLDMASLDGKQLLADYEQEMACFATTPFDAHGERLRLYPCGVTIWSGFPGAGKTTLLRQLACHLLQRDQGVFFASLEEHPKHLLVRLAATAAGTDRPNAHQVQWFIDAYAGRLSIWSKVGLAKHRDILAVIRKLAAGGVTHAVIDSLMKLDIATQDWEGQRNFANLVAATAQQTHTHIHVVAHPKKPPLKDEEPDTNDVGGARELSGIADNVLFVRRSRKEGENPTADVTGMRITVAKQRHGFGSLGDITGWFHRRARQFNLDQFSKPIRYLPADAYE